ncbi:MAG TPA: barstar family protein [Thermomicrobiales bacterium]|nr:barstar family protein [Thermomicrobiales bacterium]
MCKREQNATRLADRMRPGDYAVASLQLGQTMRAAAETEGLTTERIDLAPATTKTAVLAEFARRLEFPAYFGHNWDAFDECFRDLAWRPVPGHTFLLAGFDRFAAAAPADWDIALRIFEAAAAAGMPALPTEGDEAADERR